jgi:copper homeostasis protein
MRSQLTLEVCVDSVESAWAAQAAGANRIELCQALFEGGLTPSAGLIEGVRARVSLPLAVMLRPRGADFCYSDTEWDVLRRDLTLAKQLGADMLVCGVLHPDGTIDRDRLREVLDRAKPLPVTFHRAFDMTRDAIEALDILMELGVPRVLTSGQERSALEGLDLITRLVKHAGQRIVVMPGGGITERNLPKIIETSGAREFHVSASSSRDSRMTFRNSRVAMGRQIGPPEYQSSVASAERIRAFRGLAEAGTP